ncbi:MAG: hypothetical protein P8O16_02320 [Algoriphagus sp.]|uniref:hypothetical protein n=1 Tax=Algoriphagus sp. TaxID=1872435 RepID=UPI0026215814|nr:hypothetical protein [Algoriphagus sp.]MDG1276087.1 hypothetical protein [Algoriphagus sp.]
MIPYKIKTLFEFIEYLNSNIDNFNQYESVLNEARFLKREKGKLKPDLNFSDKMKSDELQEGIIEKFEVIKENIIIPIINKSIELDICDFNNEREKLTGSWRNKYHSEIHDLKKNFNREDLSDLFSFKKKYLDFRIKTKGETYLGLDFFFGDLDDVTKDLFDFFKVTDFNEFEKFEEKAIKASNIQEVGKLFQQGAKKITLPIDFLNPSTIQQEIKNDALEPYSLEKEKLNDLITHVKSIEIVKGIKTQYKNIKGKRLKLLLMALQDLNLLPKERIAQKFYNCCKEEFGWNIASYPAMNDYKFNDTIDKNELESMKKYIETLTR